MEGKEPSSPLSTADEPHGRPESFCALYHWCESQRGWNRQVDQGRFGTSFVSHLKRLKQAKIASEFRARIRNDTYSDAIINDAQRLSVTLAIQTEELSEGWSESRAGDNSVEIPPSPLRRPGDFVAWFGSCLENLPKPGTEKYNAAPTAVKLWDDYQRAKGWAKQHGFGKLVPRIDPENDVRTTEWLRDRKGIAPCTRDAHVALNLLVEAIGKDLANDPPTSSSSKRFDKPAQTTSVEMIENLNRLEGSLDELMPYIRRLTEVAHNFDLEADGTTWNDDIGAEDVNWVQLIDDVAFVKKDRDTVDSMLLRVKSDLEKVRDQLPILKTDIVTFPCPARTHAEAAFEYALKHWELACRRFKEECPIAKLDSLDARVMRSIRRSSRLKDDEFYAEESRYKDAVSRWRLHQLRDWVIGCRKLLSDTPDPYTFFLEIQARYRRELTEARIYFAKPTEGENPRPKEVSTCTPKVNADHRNTGETIPKKVSKKRSDQGKEEAFKSALRSHHKYEVGGSVINFKPISTRQLETLTDKLVSDSTARRLMKKHFGSVQKYHEACLAKSIGPKLVILLGDGLHAFGTLGTNIFDVADSNENDSNE